MEAGTTPKAKRQAGEVSAEQPAGEPAANPVAGEPAADEPVAGEAAPATAGDQDAAGPLALDDPALFLNRELSLLSFQSRVLEEAQDPANPLLERVKFLSILGSNLAEFFMVRIAGLRQQIESGVAEPGGGGLTPAETLRACHDEAYRLMSEARQTFSGMLPELRAAGIHIHQLEDLNEDQRRAADAYFDDKVFPVLTPLAFDPGRPFPHISNLSLNLAVLLRDDAGQRLFARVKVPQTLPRFVRVPTPGAAAGAPANDREAHFAYLEQLIAAHLDRLFPGLALLGSYGFRVTRNAEMAIQELEADDLLETIEEGVRRRRFGHVVRCSIEERTPQFVRDILTKNLEIDADEIVALKPPLGTSGLMELYGLDRPDLKDAAFVPAMPAEFEDGAQTDVFAVMRRHDILLHHPYDSFTPVLELARQAARDPDVLAVKWTLYRVGRNAPIVKALLDAADNGKEVAVLVELKARFDEESNIEWAKALEAAGAHVVYGLVGLKTHAKLALVVRREGERIRRYVHVGTGNYNAVTARLYTDLGLMTCDEQIGADASDVFNRLTGYSSVPDFRKFLVAPAHFRTGMSALIHREIEHQRRDASGHLIFKMNALVDKQFCRLLYEASQAGVRCELLVRGICRVRPGIPGVSENITVTSIVGRFLEHSRVYWFNNGGNEQLYIGSGDLMPRNLDRRVEVITPVEDPTLRRRLREEVLPVYMRDTVKARRMLPDGSYESITPTAGDEPLNAMEWFIAHRGHPET
jgi:polyphosphate kinase